MIILCVLFRKYSFVPKRPLVCLFVCLFACVQDISKSWGRIWVKFCGQVQCVKRTKWLDFCEDPDPDPTTIIFLGDSSPLRGQKMIYSTISQKVVDGFGRNLVDMLGVSQWRIDSILVRIRNFFDYSPSRDVAKLVYNTISEKVVDRFGRNLVDMLGVWQGRIDSNLVKIQVPENPNPDYGYENYLILKWFFTIERLGQNDTVLYSMISQKVVEGFGRNLVDMLGAWQDRIISILVKIRIGIRIG